MRSISARLHPSISLSRTHAHLQIGSHSQACMCTSSTSYPADSITHCKLQLHDHLRESRWQPEVQLLAHTRFFLEDVCCQVSETRHSGGIPSSSSCSCSYPRADGYIHTSSNLADVTSIIHYSSMEEESQAKPGQEVQAEQAWALHHFTSGPNHLTDFESKSKWSWVSW